MSKRNRIKPLINTHDLLFKNSKVQYVLFILAVLLLLWFFFSPDSLRHRFHKDIAISAIGNLIFAAAAYVAYFSCSYLCVRIQTAIAAIFAYISSLFSLIFKPTRRVISSLTLRGTDVSGTGNGKRRVKSIRPPYFDWPTFYWPANGCIEDICIDLLPDEHTPKEYLLSLLKYRFSDLDRHFYEIRPTDAPHPLISLNQVSFLPHHDCSNANGRQLILQGNLASYKYIWYLYYSRTPIFDNGNTISDYIRSHREKFYLNLKSRNDDFTSIPLDQTIPNPLGITGVIHVSGNTPYYILQFRDKANVDGGKLQWSYATLIKAFDRNPFMQDGDAPECKYNNANILSSKRYAVLRLMDEIYFAGDSNERDESLADSSSRKAFEAIYEHLLKKTKPLGFLINEKMIFQPELLFYTDVNYLDISKLEMEIPIATKKAGEIHNEKPVHALDLAGKEIRSRRILYVEKSSINDILQCNIPTRDIFGWVLAILNDSITQQSQQAFRSRLG